MEFNDGEGVEAIDSSYTGDKTSVKKIRGRYSTSVPCADRGRESQKEGQQTAVKKNSSRNPSYSSEATQTDSWIGISKQIFYIVSAAILVLIILNGIIILFIFCRKISFNYDLQPIENNSTSQENINKRLENKTEEMNKEIIRLTSKRQSEIDELFEKSSAFELEINTINKAKIEIEQIITDVKRNVNQLLERMSDLLNCEAKLDSKIPSIFEKEKNMMKSWLSDQNKIIEEVNTSCQKDVAFILAKSTKMESNLKVYSETVEKLQNSLPDNDELTSKLMIIKELSEKIDVTEQVMKNLSEHVKDAEDNHLQLRNAVQEEIEVYIKRFPESPISISEHQTVVEKVEALEKMTHNIYHNTFNKSAVMAVFGLIFLLIFGIYISQLKDRYNREGFSGKTEHMCGLSSSKKEVPVKQRGIPVEWRGMI